MDRQIKDSLEEYLRGAMKPGPRQEFERRLGASDEQTRQTVAEFERHATLIREAYRAADDAAPAPGFYGRVMSCIQEQRGASIWFAFLDPMFSRRLAFASLTLLMLLSVTMLTTGPEQQPPEVANTPASYHVMEAMAQQEGAPVLGQDQDEDRSHILVNLATYQEH